MDLLQIPRVLLPPKGDLLEMKVASSACRFREADFQFLALCFELRQCQFMMFVIALGAAMPSHWLPSDSCVVGLVLALGN